MAQEGLGRLFDISAGIVPVDSQTAAMTGNRVSLKNAGGCTIVVYKAAGTANDDPVLDLQQHTAASGGTTADLDIIDHYYIKQEATLDGDETWTRVTQSAASEVTLNSTSAETQMIVVIEVDARSLSDGYDYISLDIADTGSAGAQLISCLYFLRDLAVQRTPANLVAPLS
ncbi:hypothetical protein [Streptomyces syringium]|uniref:hypothetical protein n=1 Tax=Streptomyces syringium TaxID=76729 RepID=UPI0033D22A34